MERVFYKNFVNIPEEYGIIYKFWIPFGSFKEQDSDDEDYIVAQLPKDDAEKFLNFCNENRIEVLEWEPQGEYTDEIILAKNPFISINLYGSYKDTLYKFFVENGYIEAVEDINDSYFVDNLKRFYVRLRGYALGVGDDERASYYLKKFVFSALQLYLFRNKIYVNSKSGIEKNIKWASKYLRYRGKVNSKLISKITDKLSTINEISDVIIDAMNSKFYKHITIIFKDMDKVSKTFAPDGDIIIHDMAFIIEGEDGDAKLWVNFCKGEHGEGVPFDIKRYDIEKGRIEVFVENKKRRLDADFIYVDIDERSEAYDMGYCG